MADLDSLVRLKRYGVEEKQKVLADIYRQIELREARKKELLERLETERTALDKLGDVESYAYFGRFSGVIQKDMERLDGEIKTFETRLGIAQEEVRTAFADLKRVEIVNERRAEEERQEIADKESQELDEIAIEGFRRKGEQ